MENTFRVRDGMTFGENNNTTVILFQIDDYAIGIWLALQVYSS